MNDGNGGPPGAQRIVISGEVPYAPLAEEPEVIKFVRLDAAHYHGAYEPETYDPWHAKQVFDETIEEAIEAEALGWDGFFLTEHHFDSWSLVPSPNILLAALAVKTSRMRLGTGVHIFPVHDPIRLAEEAGMLDVMSGGRLEFGVGRGNFHYELDRFTAPKQESVPRFDENLDVFTKAIHADSFSYDGRWTKVRKPSTIFPRPMQRSLPIWIGASSPATVEKVAQLGHNLAAHPDQGERLGRYVEASRKIGRTVSGANYAAVVTLFVAPTDAEAERIAIDAATGSSAFASKRLDPVNDGPAVTFWTPDGFMKAAVFGSPRTVHDKLVDILRTCGARRLLAIVRFSHMPTEVARQTQRLFAQEVAPGLRRLKTKA
jgi:alkanesulfonate monooxygenase SsuD/methylene tetrahydromethanopterin reductase-like flavin-dependent oxidoreductase (luciferase family)